MTEHIDKQKVLDYLNGYLHSLDEDADTLFNRGQRRALINTFQDILAVQPVDRWISVKDRLPESEKEVLVWYRYTWGAAPTSYGFGINVWHSNVKRWREGCLLKGVEVLYWQPLPEPPKGGDTNG